MELMRIPVTVVILAAGLGTRMKSRKAKVLHRAGGKALIEHVVETALKLAPAERIFVVVGHQADDVRKAVAGMPGASGIGFIEQTEQKGTGHALMVGREALAGLDGYLVIVYGDGPLLRAETLERLVEQAAAGCPRGPAAGVLLSAMMDDATGYGRVIRGAGARGPTGCENRRAEGRHAGGAGHPRSQHGDLLLPRGPVLEACGRDPPGQPGG